MLWFLVDFWFDQNSAHILRGVVPGDAGGAMVPPDFGRSGNPISTRGTDYAHLITTGIPEFSDLLTALILEEFGVHLLFSIGKVEM